MGCDHIILEDQEQRLTREEWQELEKNQALERKKEHQCELRIDQLAKQMMIPCQIKEGQDFPSPKRGLEGLKEADRILKEKGLIGILIGGLGRDLYSNETPQKTLVKLATHKDIDVLVLPPEEKTEDYRILPNTQKYFTEFEGGIDWWYFQEKIEEKSDEYIQRIYNSYGITNFFILGTPSSYSLATTLLKVATSEKPGLHILPEENYKRIFSIQKNAEMLKLHSDFEELKYRMPSYDSGKKTLIPEISELFPITDDIDKYYRMFRLDQEAFDKVWNKQQGTIEKENKNRENLRKKLREASTEDERLTIAKELSLDRPNRKREANKLRDLRIARDEYLQIRSGLKKKSQNSK